MNEQSVQKFHSEFVQRFDRITLISEKRCQKSLKNGKKVLYLIELEIKERFMEFVGIAETKKEAKKIACHRANLVLEKVFDVVMVRDRLSDIYYFMLDSLILTN